jgi:hypothetical protein
VVKLLSSGIITKEEAKDILFNVEEEGERDKKSLESEIKFLRELVEKLSNGKQIRIVETIREIKVPYYINQPWYQPYQVWCGNYSGWLGQLTTTTGSGVTNAVYNTAGSLAGSSSSGNTAAYTMQATGSNNLTAGTATSGINFSGIKTF